MDTAPLGNTRNRHEFSQSIAVHVHTNKALHMLIRKIKGRRCDDLWVPRHIRVVIKANHVAKTRNVTATCRIIETR